MSINTFTIPALKAKRAAIAGPKLALERQIRRHRRQLANLDAIITRFEPTTKPDDQAYPKAQRSQLSKLDERGRLNIDALIRGKRRCHGHPEQWWKLFLFP